MGLCGAEGACNLVMLAEHLEPGPSLSPACGRSGRDRADGMEGQGPQAARAICLTSLSSRFV